MLDSVIGGKEKELRDGRRGGGEAVVEKQAAESRQRSGNCARMFATYNVVRAMAAATVTRSAWSDGRGSVPRIPVSGLVPRR